MDQFENEAIKRRDFGLDVLWHPYTQMKELDTVPPLVVKEAFGPRIFDEQGQWYYDAISSWWCVIHGHRHHKIVDAIRAQLDQFDHVMFGGLTHQPAIDLAKKLVEITPAGLDRVFYSDNGSTAVEVALKMSLQYWQNVGQDKKQKFLRLDNAYHGDTVGAMSVSGVGLFRDNFAGLMFESTAIPVPTLEACRSGETLDEAVDRCLAVLRKTLEDDHRSIAAMIVEPLLQGAGGMHVYPESFLQGIRILTTEFGVHLIADEVATGFGRTGAMFACEKAGISPDLMCLSKGLTSGTLPLAATMASEAIFKGFYGDYAERKTFYHGHTFTANPIACAAALASLKAFEEEETLVRMNRIIPTLQRKIQNFGMLPAVTNLRGIGMVAAFDLVKPDTQTPFSFEDRIGKKVSDWGVKEKLLIRPLGNTVYLFLPLCVTDFDVTDICNRLYRVLGRVV